MSKFQNIEKDNSWLDDPLLKKWLEVISSVTGKIHRCKVCGIILGNNYGELKSHGNSRKHRKNEKSFNHASSIEIQKEDLKLEDFSSQLEVVLHRARLTYKEVQRFKLVGDDLLKVFNAHWPDSKLEAFGSTVAGLAIKGSDIDYVAIVNDNSTANITTVSGRILLTEYPEVFNNVKLVTGVNDGVSVLQFNHIPTKTKCDLVFNQYHQIQYTELIKYILTLDHRVKPLYLIVKIWSNVHKLATPALDNYAWSHLLMFYLQKVNILPPISELQKLQNRLIIDGWNVGFGKSYEHKYFSNNNDTLYKLFGGFFEFYSKFDFKNNVVSPFSGKAIHKDTFQDVKKVPKVFKLYKIKIKKHKALPLDTNSPICIQDMVFHNENCALNITNDFSENVLSYIKRSAILYRTVSEKEFLTSILTKNVVKTI